MSADSTSHCIYCKRSSILFNREHVIPEAFGSFGAKTMILTGQVCVDCNSRLGRELDQILARDTFEGSLRVEKLSQCRHKRDRFKLRRLTFRVPDEPQFADLRGARMILDWSTRKFKLLDQIVVRDDAGFLHGFTIKEIATADETLFRNRPPRSIRSLGTSPAAVKKLQQLAESKGGRFPSDPTSIDPPPAWDDSVVLETEGLIDDRVWRAIAKIAFNYLANIQGSAYVLGDKFDRIRAFILGELKGRALVRLTKRPILADESPRWKSHDMHLVLFERVGYSLIGRVSLFNSFTYEVMLCPDLGVIYPIKSGHAFDPERKDVYELRGVSRSLKIRSNRAGRILV